MCTAGGKVYSWGFGMDGQLGLGSLVMATRPRRLRHSFLEEGASFVACGDTFSAVITASGRLYLWGRNSHTIEEGKVTDPVCVNPHPSSPPLRHLTCGAWHVAALTGMPAFVPVAEAESMCSDDETASSTRSSLSRRSSANSALDANRGGGEGGGRMEVSAPPNTTTTTTTTTPTTPRGPSLAKPPPFLVARGKTKLTIGEFYAASSEASSSSDKASSRRSSRLPRPPSSPQTPSAPPPKPTSTSPTTSTSRPKTTPLVIEVPSISVGDSDSDLEEVLPVSTKEDMMMDDDEEQAEISAQPKNGNGLPPLLLPRESPCGRKEEEEEEEEEMRSLSRSNNTGSGMSEWPPVRVRECLIDTETNNHPGKAQSGTNGGENRGRRGWGREGGGQGGVEGGGGRGGGRGGGQKGGREGRGIPIAEAVSFGPKSRTSLSTNNHHTGALTASRTPAGRPSPGREKSLIVSKNMDILDASQLLTGGGPAGVAKKGSTPTSAATVYTLGRPYGAEKCSGGLGYFQEFFGAFPPGFDDLGDFDSDYLEASPRALSKDVPMQPVPTVQLDGDFGKTISQAPRYVKRSATFFGALSGQVTQSPTKFFRKPTSSGHSLSRTTIPSSRPTPTPYTPLTRSRTHIGGGGGGRGGEVRGGRGENPARPSRRGLDTITGTKSSTNRADSLYAPASTALPHGGLHPQGPNSGTKIANTRAPFFSSAASWRQRPVKLHEHLLHDVQSQSAPNSSKVLGRKHVAFAENVKPASGGTSKPSTVKISSSAGTSQASKPSPAFALGSSSSVTTPRPSDLMAENAGVPVILQEGSNPSVDRHPGGKALSRTLVGEEFPGKNENMDNKSPRTVRQGSTLNYRTSLEKEADSSKHALQQLSARTGGLKSMPGSSRSNYATSASELNRSRTKMIVSGAGERNRKQFN
ncbi:hypothetical protein ACOMHN_001126 [Nucella lapillus]